MIVPILALLSFTLAALVMVALIVSSSQKSELRAAAAQAHRDHQKEVVFMQTRYDDLKADYAELQKHCEELVAQVIDDARSLRIENELPPPEPEPPKRMTRRQLVQKAEALRSSRSKEAPKT